MSEKSVSDSLGSNRDVERLKKDLDRLTKSLRETDETVGILWKEFEEDDQLHDAIEELRVEIHKIEMKILEMDLDEIQDEIRDEIREVNEGLETLVDEEGKGIREELEDLLSERSEDHLSDLTDLREHLDEEIAQIRNEMFEDKDEAKKLLLEMLEAIEPLQGTLEDHERRLNRTLADDEFTATRRKIGTYLVVIGAIINVIFLIREWQFYSETGNELAGMLISLGVGTSATAIGAAMMSKDY